MVARALVLFLSLLVLAGCGTVGSISGGGISGYYANQPDGTPFFRISQSISGYEMAVRDGEGWTKPRKLERLSLDNANLKAVPWLANIIESAYGIDGFTFMQFKQDATISGQKLPTRYSLHPGGFAYKVAAP